MLQQAGTYTVYIRLLSLLCFWDTICSHNLNYYPLAPLLEVSAPISETKLKAEQKEEEEKEKHNNNVAHRPPTGHPALFLSLPALS